jgi:hypothetical protein
MPGPRDARELKRMNRVLAGILKDKDRARRKRRLAGAASPSRHEPPTRRKPELEPEPEDWDLETAEPGDDSRRTLARAVPPPGAATEAPMAVDSLLTRPEFPLSARYDRDWLLDNQMGPNAISRPARECSTSAAAAR